MTSPPTIHNLGLEETFDQPCRQKPECGLAAISVFTLGGSASQAEGYPEGRSAHVVPGRCSLPSSFTLVLL